MNKTKSRIESRTHRVAGIVMLLGIIMQNADALKPFLGDYGGVAFAALGGVFAILREVTSKPISGTLPK